MTPLLQQAVAAVSLLTPWEQDEVAARLLAELEAEDAFDRAIAASGEKLDRLAREAVAEIEAGETEELDPDCM